MNAELAAKDFANDWNGHGDEISDMQDFWRDLLRDVFGVERTTGFIKFNQSIDETLLRIDGIIERTKVLIEHKSFGVNLDKRARQSDGEYLTPFEQAKRYAEAMPYSIRPRWIVTCNFDEFRIYDLAELNSLEYLLGTSTYKPKLIKLAELRYEYMNLKFLVDPNAKLKPEVKISTDAAKIIKKICEVIDKNYRKSKPAFRDALSKFCARLVFCFYADDAQIFQQIKFGDWLKKIPLENLRTNLQKLFDVLDMPDVARPENLDEDLKKFPRVNGGLFDEELDLPPLNKFFRSEVLNAHNLRSPSGQPLMDEAQKEFIKFSWRGISPTIFGALVESIFNIGTKIDDRAKAQREGGMYYTSEDNIRKVIEPLFLDDLSNELAAIKRKQNVEGHLRDEKIRLLKNFQDKIASLNFLDPACGSGNFLTETYLCLRDLENEVLKELCKLHVEIPADPIKVTPRQFYGIEINDFAVAIARLALWISEIKMRRKTSWIIHRELPDLPLSKYISIHKANANQIDWSTIVAPANVNYIIGNPPFVGARMKSDDQAADITKVFDGWKNLGNLDYVTCWYKKSADFIRGTKIRCAFVSTNSVCQGESVGTLWKKLFDGGIHIDFARRTFKWLSDSDNMAHVHCVIVGFSHAPNDKDKVIFDGDKEVTATNINAYLVDGENIFVESRNEPLQADVPTIGIGNKPIDDGNYLFKPDEREDFLRDEPAAAKFFRPWYGADEFIKGKRRYCLWLGDTPEEVWRKLPLVAERVENVRRYRLSSKSPGTRKIADKPTRFHVENFPHGKYIAIPEVTASSRLYIPIGFMNDSVLCSNKIKIISDATLYHFGVLTSSIHMAWMRMTNCPLGTSYSYSIAIVYNNFPWPQPTTAQRRLIEQSAQMILDARAKFSDWTFAKLYDEETMPDELRSAHHTNDYNVALAYGFQKFLHDEAKVVAELMKLYASLA
ncbi:MAG: class I SAM-dependent DNA methyltransferase [Selenomonadaceae bacterium]|nr:class I SAM-dependent DNA methyltransferase [Selenomonadaceae bacterium]